MMFWLTKGERGIWENWGVNMSKYILEEMSILYSQEGDSCSSDMQDIEIKTQDAGGGKYLVIKTERWALESAKELTDLVRDFQRRLELKSKLDLRNE